MLLREKCLADRYAAVVCNIPIVFVISVSDFSICRQLLVRVIKLLILCLFARMVLRLYAIYLSF